MFLLSPSKALPLRVGEYNQSRSWPRDRFFFSCCFFVFFCFDQGHLELVHEQHELSAVCWVTPRHDILCIIVRVKTG